MAARRFFHSFAALLILCAAFLPAPATAQQVSVAISPPSGNTYFTGPLSVTIQWCAVGATLDPSQRDIRFNGQNVSNAFGWSAGSQGGCDDYAVSTGTVTLGAGPNTFNAAVPAYYEPPPPPPPCPPTCDQRPPPGPSAELEYAAADYVWGGATAAWSTLAPIVSLAPYSSGVLRGGFNVVFSHSTPAYFSLGQARGVTVAYNSSTVRPTPVIFLDVSNAPGSSPTGYFVQVRKAGVLLKLLNDTNFVYYTPSTGTPVRLALALDAQANLLGTGWHDVTVTVTSLMTAGNQSNTVPTRVLIVDQNAGPFGKGVDLTGVQRVRTMPGSYSVLVTEGDGSAAFFETLGNCETCGFTSPAGEASILTKITDPTLGLMFRRKYGDGSVVDFTSNGRIRRAAGRFGDTTQFIWTDTLLTQIRDPMGKTLTLAYTAGKLNTVTDPAGRVTTYAIDGSGRLYRVTDPDTVATNVAYDATSLLTGVTDRGGALTTFTYDALRRIDTTYAPTIQIHTGSNVRPRSVVTAPERVVWQPSTPGTSIANRKLSVRPDTLFAVAVVPNGAITKSALDRFGNPTRVIGPYGETTTIARDTLGRALVTTNPNGHVTRKTYAGGFIGGSYAVGQVKDSTTGRIISYGYTNSTAGGLLTSTTGDVTRIDLVYHTGSRGPVGAVDTVFGVNRTVLVSTHLPDALGRDTIVTDGGQHRTRIAYESVWGNVREKTSPRGSVTRFHYDAAGRVDSTWVPTAGLYTYQYDVLNRQTQVKDPLGHVTRYVYGPTTLNRVIDPKGQVYKFSYNALRLLVVGHDLADTLKADTLKYDEAGSLRTLRSRRDDIITMTYDLVGRLRSRSGPDFPVDSFKYDPAGRWNVAWNINARDSVAYDQAGRPATTRQALPGGAYELAYTFDTRDRITTRTPPVGTTNVRYRYKPTSGVLDTLCAVGACVAFGYNGEQLRDTVTYNPGLSGSWKRLRFYDSTHATVRDSFSLVGLDTLFGGRWWHDSIGRLQWEDSSAAGTRKRRYYEYDALGRLVDACDEQWHTIIDINGNPQRTYSTCTNEYGAESGPPFMGGGPKPYAYDSAGNRVDPAANATIGSGNRVLSFRNYTLGYDANGNIVSKAGNGIAFSYTWDALGRLKEVRNGGVLVASFAYDALGRRVSKTLGSGPIERYVYDGDQVILDLTGSHAVKAEYGYNAGTDRLLAIRNNLSPAWTGIALTDPKVGTVRGIANVSGGALRKKHQLTAWGQGAADTGIVTRYRMAGREYDQESGLYYMRARYYDPELGRFLSEDPLGIAGGLNLYTYVASDPVNARDPSGLCKDPGTMEKDQSAAAASSDDPPKDGGDDCGDDGDGDAADGAFDTWGDVWAWIDWAWAQGYDYASWTQGTVFVANVVYSQEFFGPAFVGHILNWDPKRPQPNIRITVPWGSFEHTQKANTPGTWDMDEYKGQTTYIQWWGMVRVNLRGLEVAKYEGKFTSNIFFDGYMEARGYVYPSGFAIFSANPRGCGCPPFWPRRGMLP